VNSIEHINEIQSKAAKIAGLSLVLSKVLVVISNFAISFRLIVPSSVTDTGHNIMANETLFRTNIALNLIYAVAIVITMAALYQIFKPINRILALVTASCWVVVALMWCISGLNMLGALRLLGDAAYLQSFSTTQLQTLARLKLASGYDAYYIGLPFWGLASTIGSYLLFRSRYIPRAST